MSDWQEHVLWGAIAFGAVALGNIWLILHQISRQLAVYIQSRLGLGEDD